MSRGSKTTALRRTALLGAVVLASACSAVATRSAHAGKILQETWEETYPVSATVTLHVRNGDGRIYIYGSEENEMKITAVKRAFTKERLDAISIHVAVEGDAATIETNVPPPPAGGITRDRSGTVEYTIIVPENCTISRAELANGEVLIEGMRGAAVNATVDNGRLLARNCFSPTQIAVGRGGMDIFYAWWEEEERFLLSGQIADGDLRVDLPRSASLRVEAVSASGHIANRFVEGEEQEGEAGRLDTTIGSGEGAEFKLRSGSGNIRIDKAY